MSSVFKAKTKEKYEENILKVFVSKLINVLFGVNKLFIQFKKKKNSVLALKTIDT